MSRHSDRDKATGSEASDRIALEPTIISGDREDAATHPASLRIASPMENEVSLCVPRD